MITRILVTFILVASSNCLVAQESRIAQLEKELQKGDKQKELLNHISKKSISSDSLYNEYGELGLFFSIDHELLGWQVIFLLNKAQNSLNRDKIATSISNSLEALQIINEFSDLQEHEGRAHYMLASGLKKIGAYKKAIDHRKKQLTWALKNNHKNKVPHILNEIGNLFIKLGKSDSSIIYFKKVYQLEKNNNSNKISISTLNNLGLGYLNNEDKDSAKFYFERAYNRLKNMQTQQDSIMFGLVSGNLSQCYNKKGNEDRIEALLNDDIRLSTKFNLFHLLTNAHIGMAELKIHMKNYSDAKKHIGLAFNTNRSTGDFVEKNELQLKIYKRYIEIYSKLKDYRSGLKYSKLYTTLNDSIYGKENAKDLANSLTTYQVTGIQKELTLKKMSLNQSREKIKMLKKEEELSKTETNLTVAIGLALLIMALLFIFKMKSDAKKRQEITKLNSQVYEASIENQTQRLTEATLSLTRKKEFSENLIDKLTNIKGLAKTDLIPFKQFVINELQIDESILETEKYISKLSKDFFVKIKLQYPHLTENDIKMCGLIRLNLSIKQIAIIKYITPESVKISKNRLSKKMNLSPGTNLYKILKQY